MEVDYLIIGQGICGTLLSWNLSKIGKSFLIIDNADPASSSMAASALINPVTGKRYVKSWLYDTLLPAALESYRSLEIELNRPLLSQCSLFQFHTSPQDRETFEEKASLLPEHLSIADSADFRSLFQSYYGVGTISPCWIIDVHCLLNSWRQVLSAGSQLLQETFDFSRLSVSGQDVTYKDIRASKIIFCEGSSAGNNPYFSLLPFSVNKGEAIIASIPGLPNEHVFKQDLKIVPWQNGLFWIGSSFVWKYDDVLPTTRFRDRVRFVLDNWLKLPYSIVEHFASERPSSVDYKPFVGIHPFHPSVAIFNGMGTKGYSQASYFAKQLADLLVGGKEILPDVSVQRYKGVLGRQN